VPIGPSYTLHSRLYYVTSVLSVGLLLPLALGGLWRLGSRRARLAGVWLLAAAAVATCLVFFPQERFRIPVIDPALILCASGLWLSGRRTGDPAAAGAVA
jgi:CHASE2 domain-containing sensor protein